LLCDKIYKITIKLAVVLVTSYTYCTVPCWCLLYAGRVCIFGDSGWILDWVVDCPD